MPIIKEVQDRLTLAFPPSSNAALYRAVQEGSYLADHLYKGESFLNNSVGRDMRGHIRRVGISHQIENYCSRGDLPFVATMKPMPKGNWHWLEIIATGALAHICRTEDVETFPYRADSRQDIRLRLQADLLNWREEDRNLRKIIRDIPKLYAWLIFRVAQDGRISHLCWASPAADSDEYIGHINVLKALMESNEAKPEISTVPDPKDSLRLKHHVADAIARDAEKTVGE